MTEPSDQNLDRRRFFREGLGSLLGPVSDFLDKRKQPPKTLPRSRLRPPGALPEPQFISLCQSCGQCVEACPADAIMLAMANAPSDTVGPWIDANLAACVVCEGLQCTQVCPSGALTPLTSPDQIRMGTAIVQEEHCLGSHGEQCSICVDHCPLGSDALVMGPSQTPVVKEDGCVGCGICQLYCPTNPKAITVLAHSDH